MKALILCAGEAIVTRELRAKCATADLVVAADGGARLAAEIGVRPNVLVGDFDSLSPDAVARLRLEGCEIIQYPTAKDQSDTELAISLATERGAREITLVGAFGGPRLDHLLANVLLLCSPNLQACDVCLLDGTAEVRLVSRDTCIEGDCGHLVTLLPIDREVRGVTTAGLQYPLHEATLRRGSSLGLSNVMTERRATVSVQEGLLLLVHELAQEHQQPTISTDRCDCNDGGETCQ